MNQPSHAEILIDQGFNSRLLNKLYVRHINRVHTHRSDGRFFPLGKPCLLCDEFVVDLTAVKYRENIQHKVKKTS